MRTDWRLVGLLFVAGLLAAAQFAKLALALPQLGEVYPGAPLPLAVSALSAMGILFGVTAGVIVARLGPRRVLLAALVTGGGLSCVQALLPAFPVLIGLRLVEGAAHLAIVVSAPTLMAGIAALRDVPVAMGIWGTFFGVGFALSALLIPFLGSPDRIFLAHGLSLLALAAVLWPRLPRQIVAAPDTAEGLLARHLTIYRTPRLIAPALGFIWHTILFMGLLTFLPAVIGPWTGPILPLIALAGTFAAGVLARTIPPHRIAHAGFAGTIAGLGLALTAAGPLTVWLVLAAFFFVGLVPGASFAGVPHLNPDAADRARANGAIAQMGNLGTSLSIPLYAALATQGAPALLGGTAVLSALGIGALALIHRKIANST